MPPRWEHLAEALREWERYYHAEEPDRLVQLAVVHAQFEFLHPFLDGNGRLGRILIPLFLFEHGMLQQPNFYLSEFLEAHREEYIARLHALGRTESAWTEWVRFFLRAIIAQCGRNMHRATAMLALYQRLKAQFVEVTRSALAVPLLDFIFTTPIFQVTQVRWSVRPPSRPTLTTMLQSLRTSGHLKVLRESAGRRGYIWSLPELIELSESTFGEGRGTRDDS